LLVSGHRKKEKGIDMRWILRVLLGGAWAARSVEHPTLELGSGLDLGVVSSSPILGVEPTLNKRKGEKKILHPLIPTSKH